MLQGVFCEQRDNLTPVPSLSGLKVLPCYFCRMSRKRLLPKSSHCMFSFLGQSQRIPGVWLPLTSVWGRVCICTTPVLLKRAELQLLGEDSHMSSMSEPLWTSERCSWQCRWGNNTWRSWLVVLGPESSQTGQKDPSSHDKESSGAKVSL